MAQDESVSTSDEEVILPDDTATEVTSTDDDAIVVEDEAEQSETAEDEETSEDAEASDDSSEEAETEEEGDSEQSDADRKEQARQRYLERQAARQAGPDSFVQAVQAEANQRLAAIEDATQRALAELQVKDQLREVQEARTSLVTDNEFAQRDFDVFNPKSDSFNEQAYNHFVEEYERAYVISDDQGNVLGTRGPSFYQYLESKADLISGLTQAGARQERKATAKMQSSATPPSSAAPKAEKTDLFGEAFDKEF